MTENNKKKKNFLSGQNFAELSDILYAGNISTNLFLKLNKENLKIISKNDLFVTFKIKNLKIKDGDIIFCSSGYLEVLFYYLNKAKKVRNLTLISGQSDRSIDSKIFNKKPDTIVNWYSTNIDHQDPKLIPIPLGLANDYSPKNIRIENFIEFKQQNIEDVEKEEKLYINLQKNTNLKERSKLVDSLKHQNWVIFKEPNLEITEYLSDLHKYKFVLCPWGNGYDTHRLWETLYAGSIPVTKYHKTFKDFSSLPIIFVNDYKEINLDLLKENAEKFKDLNLEILNFEYWKNKTSEQVKDSLVSSEEIFENPLFEYFYWQKHELKRKIRNKLKIARYYFHKILKKISY